MIESLRRSQCRLLALFAVCTYAIGFFVTIGIYLFNSASTASLVPDPAGWNPHFLERNAVALAARISVLSFILMFASFSVMATAYIVQADKKNLKRVRLFAKILYIFSFIATTGAVSTAVFFSMCRQ